MVQVTHGADVEALRDIGPRFIALGKRAEGVVAEGQAMMTTLRGAWEGADFEELDQRWQRTRRRADEAAQALGRRGVELLAVADEQEQTSSSSGVNVEAPHAAFAGAPGGGGGGAAADGGESRAAFRDEPRDPAIGGGPARWASGSARGALSWTTPGGPEPSIGALTDLLAGRTGLRQHDPFTPVDAALVTGFALGVGALTGSLAIEQIRQLLLALGPWSTVEPPHAAPAPDRDHLVMPRGVADWADPGEAPRFAVPAPGDQMVEGAMKTLGADPVQGAMMPTVETTAGSDVGSGSVASTPSTDPGSATSPVSADPGTGSSGSGSSTGSGSSGGSGSGPGADVAGSSSGSGGAGAAGGSDASHGGGHPGGAGGRVGGFTVGGAMAADLATGGPGDAGATRGPSSGEIVGGVAPASAAVGGWPDMGAMGAGVLGAGSLAGLGAAGAAGMALRGGGGGGGTDASELAEAGTMLGQMPDDAAGAAPAL